MYFSYASTKRCSNEGRALMQLDFQQLLRKLERIIEDFKYVFEKSSISLIILFWNYSNQYLILVNIF